MRKKIRFTTGDRIFLIIDYIILTIAMLTCLLPMLHVIALSFSDSVSASTNSVLFLPKGFNTLAYKTMFSNPIFFNSFLVSIVRTVVGTAANMILTVMAAYPLSKEDSELRGRKWISLFFIIPMLIGGGLIPNYFLVKDLGLMDTLWALILPGCLPIGNMVMMMNFFRGISKSLFESAEIDGANDFVILFCIALPLSLASIATLTLFQVVGHWNEWFGATIYINNRNLWPLQTLLHVMLTSIDYNSFSAENLSQLRLLSDRSFRGAMIVFATVPILCIYPFMQKYFVSGITIGSVKE